MLNRNILEELESQCNLMPVTFVMGARQSGKTTLIEAIAQQKELPTYTLDDSLTLSNALRDPSGWIASLPKPVVIDEVQRAPELFLSIKRDVDAHRKAGRYLLTGSANPLVLPKLGDSLAGRMGIVTLYPFSQGELHHTKEEFLPFVFGDAIVSQTFPTLSPHDLYHILLRGGFPLVQSISLEDVRRWVRSYLKTMIERDVRDLANIEGLREFPRLFQLLATRASQFLNVADISRTLGMIQTTVHRYLGLLEALFFIHLVPAWFSNLGKRIIKSPKIHIADTAILGQLLDVDITRLQSDPHLTAQFLESFVFIELNKQRTWAPFPVDLYHFRDGDREVDLVLEKPDQTLIGIEVKSARSLQNDDLKGLLYLQSLAGPRFKRGIILHPSDRIESIGPNLWAFPIQSLWKNRLLA